MTRSDAKTVGEYLSALPPERREVVGRVREAILAHLPHGYEEAMGWGMISYQIPLHRYPDTYNGKPLSYVGLAAQKNHYAIYLMGVYADAALEKRLRADFVEAGKTLDMGKSCVRFRKLDDVPLDAIGRAVSATSVEAYIELYEAARRKT